MSKGNRSAQGGHGLDGHRSSIGLGGGGPWIQVPLYWWVIAAMVLMAVSRWLVRWRMELTGLVLVWVYASVVGQHVGGRKVALLLLAVELIAVAIWPTGRAFLVSHLWCMVSRHRVRGALGQAGVASRQGRLPYVARVRPTAVGTMVTVWMRSGTAVEQLGQDDSAKVGILRAACWAREVRISRHPRWAHLVNLHLVRLDPLAPSVHVASTLPDLLNAARGAEQPEPVDVVVIPNQSASLDEGVRS